MSIDRSLTLSDLVAEALRKTFFTASGSHEPDTSTESPLPFTRLQGVLKNVSTSTREIRRLKKIWNSK